MTNDEYERLNGEQLMHTVWIKQGKNVVGWKNQTIQDLPLLLGTHDVVRIDCEGGTIEAKIRDIGKFGD